jgi:hypothetical protein
VPSDAEVKIQLEPGASVSGVVVTAAGSPVRDYTIQVDWDRPPEETPMPFRVRDAQGTFSADGLGPGAHELAVHTAEAVEASVVVHLGPGESKTTCASWCPWL